MAKGNMLLGYSRGSVGDVTFYRSGGSQRQRARNRQPNNPRTARQMAQRSVFANAVKFFKQVNSGFFRFAYEDKKTNESDYNAFMRHNVQNSGYIGAKASKIADFPALGLWQMSAGSLREITAPFPQPVSTNAMFFDLGVTFSDILTTVGEFSSKLINDAPSIWRAGDIFTFVVYHVNNASVLPTVYTDLGISANANYAQFVLNTSDNTSLESIKVNVGECNIIPTVGSNGFALGGDDAAITDIWANDLLGFSVIHSRNTATGLKVSSSMMVFNKTEKVLSAMSDSGEYYNEVLADWQASAEAILQGASAQSAEYVLGWSSSADGPFNFGKLNITSVAEEQDTTLYVKFNSEQAAIDAESNFITTNFNGATSSVYSELFSAGIVRVIITHSLPNAQSVVSVSYGNISIADISRSN